MPEPFVYNIIRYKGVNLQLDGEFTWKAGLDPDVNTFTVGYDDFARLKETMALPGDLEFLYYRNQTTTSQGADMRIQLIKMVGWDVIDQGTQSDLRTVGPLRYKITLTDSRQRFLKPRGGWLKFKGVINARDTIEPLQKNSELILKCAQAMGVAVEVPPQVDQLPPPRDLKWLGNHAPTELENLLDRIGAVLVLTMAGDLKVYMLGDGEDFTGPPIDPDRRDEQFAANSRRLPTVSAGVDRRARIVAFTSYPNPGIERYKLSGPSNDTWQFVAPDPQDNDVWKKLEEITALPNPVDAVRTGFINIDKAFREPLQDNVYHCIRLNPDKYGRRPIMSTGPVVKKDRAVGDFVWFDAPILIKEKTFQVERDGRFKNTGSLVKVTASELKDHGTILKTHSLLGKLSTDQAVRKWEPYFKALESGDLYVECCMEMYDKDTDQLKYFEVGYTLDADGQIQKLGPDETSNALASADADAIVITQPEWVMYRQNNEDVNRLDLENKAKALAQSILKGSIEPAEIRSAVGFFKIELSGKMSEIRISQSPVKTTWNMNTWWLPRDAYLTRIRLKEKKGDKEAYPSQAATQSQKSGDGGSGATQPVILLSTPVTTPTSAKPQLVAKLTGKETRGGTYNAVIVAILDPSDPTVAGSALSIGVTVGDEVVFQNSDENDLKTHWLKVPSFVIGDLLGEETLPAGAAEGAVARQQMLGVGITYDTNTGKTLGSHSNTSTDADAVSWDRTKVDHKALSSFKQRIAWDGTLGKLVGFTREERFDAGGRKTYESPETKYDLITGDPC